MFTNSKSLLEQATIEEDKAHADTKMEIREKIRNLRHRVFKPSC